MSAEARITRMRARLVAENPFWGTLMLHLKATRRDDLPTMATDGIHLFYNPSYVDTLTDAELLGVGIHETEHCALGHFDRIGERDLEQFNIAADLAINPGIIRRNYTLPPGILNDPQYDMMTAEEIYAKRRADKARQDKAENQSGKPAGEQGGNPAPGGTGSPDKGAGKLAGEQGGNVPANGKPGGPDAAASGAPGGSANPYGVGGIMRPEGATQGEVKALAEQWEIRTRQAAAVANKAGDLPGNAKTVLDHLNRPTVDFRDVLASLIDSRVTTETSWNRPNRRFISSGLYLPGSQMDAIQHLVFIFDTSGSITAKMAQNAADIIVAAIEAGKVERATVVYADTKVRGAQTFEFGDIIEPGDLDIRGGGGTRFDHALAWAADNCPDATAAIYLTDMVCRHFGEEPEFPLIWAIHGTYSRFTQYRDRAPFGEPVYVGLLD